jgi:hypothetical protein
MDTVTPPASVIDTGTAAYFCSNSGGTTTCVSSGTTDPLAGLADLFSPATAITDLQEAQTELGEHIAGYSFSYSSQTFAGQPSTCVHVGSSAHTAEYCVTKQGILAYEGSGGKSFSLTSYSRSVPASDFSLPAGATVETIPSGISIPSIPS